MVEISIYSMNPEYVSYILTLRYILLAISVVIFIFYCIRHFKFERNDLAFEKKYIFVLGIFLILFNDPLFAESI